MQTETQKQSLPDTRRHLVLKSNIAISFQIVPRFKTRQHATAHCNTLQHTAVQTHTGTWCSNRAERLRSISRCCRKSITSSSNLLTFCELFVAFLLCAAPTLKYLPPPRNMPATATYSLSHTRTHTHICIHIYIITYIHV